jgi:hypothetical protein
MLTITAILPWAATRGDAARAKRKALVNMLAVVGVGLRIDNLKYKI